MVTKMIKKIFYTIIFGNETRVDKFYINEKWAQYRAARLQIRGLDARVLVGKLTTKNNKKREAYVRR